MKSAELFKRYFWLIDVINQSDGISRNEINRRWSRSTLNYRSESEIPERTFHRHKEAIKELFDIDIICDHSTEKLYRIKHSDIDVANNIRSWMLDTFSLGNVIMESRNIQERILVENIPSGHRFLSNIVKAMQENRTLNISYKNFFNDNPWSFDIEPYCLKLFHQRWYLLARSPYDEKMRIYGLDRINGMYETDRMFQLPPHFDAAAVFENSFGIIIGTDEPTETIKFKAINNQQNYIRSLPLHHTQQEILCEPAYSIFTIQVKPTFDLIQEFLKFGDNLEIIYPISLRTQLSEITERMNNIYKRNE